MGPKRIVIIGSGFAGLWAAKALSRSGADVLIIDRNNYHTFPPLLYQVAAAEISPEDIAFPIRGILSGYPGVRFGMYEALGIDLDARVVRTSCRDIEYDYLIIAAGSTTGFLGVEGAEEHCFEIKTLEQSIQLRNHILTLFESSACDMEIGLKCQPLNIVTVGGGPTGIEYAGALSELVRGPISKDYPSLDCSQVQIILLEAGERLLPDLSEKTSEYVRLQLRRMGVDVRLRSAVSKVTPSAVYLKDGKTILTNTVVWTAGVRGISEVTQWGLPVGPSGRVAVQPTLQIQDHPEVYVAGDLAYVEGDDGRALPMTAPVAIQEATTATSNIMRDMQGKPPLPFRFHDKGFMVTIGRKSAVAQISGRTFTGIFAWFLWLAVHIYNLIGFRNRLFVLVHWARDYFFHDKSIRLILGTRRSARVSDDVTTTHPPP